MTTRTAEAKRIEAILTASHPGEREVDYLLACLARAHAVALQLPESLTRDAILDQVNDADCSAREIKRDFPSPR